MFQDCHILLLFQFLCDINKIIVGMHSKIKFPINSDKAKCMLRKLQDDLYNWYIKFKQIEGWFKKGR